jgi:hypothetical protein
MPFTTLSLRKSIKVEVAILVSDPYLHPIKTPILVIIAPKYK